MPPMLLPPALRHLPPIVTSSLLALVIDCCSNTIAQRLRAWKLGVPFQFDWVLFSQFAIMVVICAPLNFLWQSWLERTFPGWKLVRREGDLEGGVSGGQGQKDIELELKKQREDLDRGLLDSMDGEEGDGEEMVRVRNWFNIFRKWFTDCIVLGALFNTTAFLVLMGIMKGKSAAQIGTDLRTEMWPIIWDSYKVWPIANFFSTTYVPVERRIVFLSFCGLIWNIYLSLVAARL